MTTLLVSSLFWDDWNLNHIQKHEITPSQAEEVVMGEPLIFSTYKNRLLLIGPDQTGRVLCVVMGQVPESVGVWYVFSARPSSKRERLRYFESFEKENS